MRLSINIAVTLCSFLLPLVTSEAQTSREQLAQYYMDDAKDHPPIYQGTPITHIVPSHNTITYSLGLDYQDTKIYPENTNSDTEESLHLKGYSASPYMAISLKRIGLGFSLAAGRKAVIYDTQRTGSYFEKNYQASTLDYRSVGVYLFWVPYNKIKWLVPTLILGGRSYTAKHRLELSYESSHTSPANKSEETLNYSVPEYNVGLNLGIKLLKALTIIPWIDYKSADTTSAKKIAEDSHDIAQTDIDLFWHSHPKLEYGLDFGIRIKRFEVRIGGALGALAASGTGSDFIEDNSMTVSLSFDTKGY